MKHEWRKAEKDIYQPKTTATFVQMPKYKFFCIQGQGNPNDAFFGDYISVLYLLSYAVKMSYKKAYVPQNYYEYTVYPLEGVWDLTEKGRNEYSGSIDKDELVFMLMIRQPEFVTQEFADFIIAEVSKAKPNNLLSQVVFKEIEEGACVQMLHKGSYDSEPVSFKQMEEYARSIEKPRKDLTHREIYLSDARKVSPEKLQTILRFKV